MTTTGPKKFVVGITDHMIGTIDLEAEVLGDDVEIDFFATRMKSFLIPIAWHASTRDDCEIGSPLEEARGNTTRIQ